MSHSPASRGKQMHGPCLTLYSREMKIYTHPNFPNQKGDTDSGKNLAAYWETWVLQKFRDKRSCPDTQNSAEVAAKQEGSGSTHLCALEPGWKEGPVPALPAMHGIAGGSQSLPSSAAYILTSLSPHSAPTKLNASGHGLNPVNPTAHLQVHVNHVWSHTHSLLSPLLNESPIPLSDRVSFFGLWCHCPSEHPCRSLKDLLLTSLFPNLAPLLSPNNSIFTLVICWPILYTNNLSPLFLSSSSWSTVTLWAWKGPFSFHGLLLKLKYLAMEPY